jgi:aminopeptidase N
MAATTFLSPSTETFQQSDTMRDAHPGAIYLKDYQPPGYLINRTELHFELGEEQTIVSSRLYLLRDPRAGAEVPLELHGEGLELLAVSVDGVELANDTYQVTDELLRIHYLPEQCVLSCTTRIKPQDNTSLEGLYKSHRMFCTQCEAHGFRKITYYLDRPDVLSVFTVTIDAAQEKYPVLLSNGNLVATEDLGNGLHRAQWHDPFPKPAYLFALVAGDLDHVEDSYTTCGGREVCLRIYVEEKDLDKCDHAMLSLKKAMRWDEEAYGREYDLDVFNIVAVDDFNMGAMENKGLNIFNTACVLCTPDITTDQGFQRIEAIVAHEYFHNWSGNRVTCRDWFQLSLKEGFTVFRDASFSADMGSPTVKRVEDVMFLRTAQFAEDAGPMAHPVRPDSYIEINNFYTLTVYEKGAEVVRMIHSLLGSEAFRLGSDLYFERHDGQAVTCEDFVVAMEDASGVDLGQFRHWYSQAGTPELRVRDDYDPDTQRYTLHVEQSCPPTPGQKDKKPFVIPLAMGLLGDAGNLPLHLEGSEPDSETADNTHRVLQVNQPRQSFVFEGVMERPVPSLLRGFSAPVRLDCDLGREDLFALMSRDDDGFVRWDSAQALAARVIVEVEGQLQGGEVVAVEALLAEACNKLLRDDSLDAAMVSDMLKLPSENYLAELASHSGGADVDTIHSAREIVLREIGRGCEESLQAVYHRLASDVPYQASAGQVAARSLRNTCLEFLCCIDPAHMQLAEAQIRDAHNMTERLGALRVITLHGSDEVCLPALDKFYRDWRHETLVVDLWFQVQAAVPYGDALGRVRELMKHQDFDLRNPNKVRALIGVFANQNPVNFHRADGEGYRFLADIVAELNGVNPQIASGLLTPMVKWHNYKGRGPLMRAELERLAAMPELSPAVYEIVTKSLA